MLTTIAPSRSTANAEKMYCGQLGSMMPTRSPLTIPSRASARGELVGVLLQLEIRELRAEKLRRRPIRPLDRRDVEDVGQRPPGIGQVRADPVVVVARQGRAA